MAFNFETKQFDPPPLLAAIYEIEDPRDQVYAFEDFVFYKSNQLKLPLTKHEQMFIDTAGLHGEILSDGWHSPFYQIHNYPQWQDIMEVLTHCDHADTADLIREAVTIFYRGRSDLPTLQSMHGEGLGGFHLTQEEEKRFFDIGDIIEQVSEFDYYPRPPALAHRPPQQVC